MSGGIYVLRDRLERMRAEFRAGCSLAHLEAEFGEVRNALFEVGEELEALTREVRDFWAEVRAAEEKA